jgi:M6 family metalloprotease-like protein
MRKEGGLKMNVKSLAFILLTLLVPGASYGVSPHPRWDIGGGSGRGSIPKGFWDPDVPRIGYAPRVPGVERLLVLLVDFPDRPARRPKSDFDRAIFGGPDVERSLRGYFLEVSGGKLDVSPGYLGGCSQWLRLKKPLSYYGADDPSQPFPVGLDKGMVTLVKDALRTAVENGIKLSEYDSDGDGYIDHLMIVHAGEDQAEFDPFGLYPNDTIWSSSMSHEFGEYGGVKAKYAMVVAEEPDRFALPIGTYCHEFMHSLGAPDLYDYGQDGDPVGYWCIMGSGSWLGGAQTPAYPSAYLRWDIDGDPSNGRVGFIDAEEIRFGGSFSLDCAESPVGTRAYILKIPGTKEFFILENRQRIGYDVGLPNSGILIWHVDEGMPDGLGRPNDGPPSNSFYKVWLEDPSDPDHRKWDSPGFLGTPVFSMDSGYTEFGPLTNPSSASNRGMRSGIWVKGIGRSGPKMDFEVELEWEIPEEIPVPTGILAVPGNGRVGISWNRVTYGSPFSYHIKALAPGEILVFETTTKDERILVDGLENGIYYRFLVSVVSDVTGKEGKAAEIHIAPTPSPKPPPPPSNVRVLPEDGMARVFWDPVEDPRIVGYSVSYSTKPFGPYFSEKVKVSGNSAVVIELTNNQTYYFKVSSVDLAGTESDPNLVTPVPATPIPSGKRTVEVWPNILMGYGYVKIRAYMSPGKIGMRAFIVGTDRISYYAGFSRPIYLYETSPGIYEGTWDGTNDVGRRLSGRFLVVIWPSIPPIFGVVDLALPLDGTISVWPSPFRPDGINKMVMAFSIDPTWVAGFEDLEVLILSEAGEVIAGGDGSIPMRPIAMADRASYEALWNGCDRSGKPLPEGEYVVAIKGDKGLIRGARWSVRIGPPSTPKLYADPFQLLIGDGETKVTLDAPAIPGRPDLQILITDESGRILCGLNRFIYMEEQSPGLYLARWDGKGDTGSSLDPGSYTIRVWSPQLWAESSHIFPGLAARIQILPPIVKSLVAWPNPFSPSHGQRAIVIFKGPVGKTDLEAVVVDPEGKRILRGYENPLKAYEVKDGIYQAFWDGKDDLGNIVMPGRYILLAWDNDTSDYIPDVFGTVDVSLEVVVSDPEFRLISSKAYPNPARSGSKAFIECRTTAPASDLKLYLYNVSGQRIGALDSFEILDIGHPSAYRFVWNPRSLGEGAYYYIVEATNGNKKERIVGKVVVSR